MFLQEVAGVSLKHTDEALYVVTRKDIMVSAPPGCNRNPINEKSFKIMQETDSDTMKVSQKYRWTPRRCTFRYGRDLWLHRCRRHCTWTRITKRIWKYSRRKFRDVSSSQWEKSTLLNDQAIKWTKARVYVYSDSVLCLEQNARQKVE